MEVDRLLRDEEEAWAALRATFGRVPADRFEEPTLTPEGWSPKDAMFHVAGWLADCARVLEQIREGTFDRAAQDALVIVEINQEWFELSRTMDVSTVRAEFEASRLKARECFATLPEVTAYAWEWFEESAPLHYREHGKDLEAWLG
jgi:hypothetical protein